MSADPRVMQLVRGVQELARARARRDLAEALDWRARALAGEQPVTFVVAGRTNSGKSSLVNALLGRPLLATGDDVPTTVAAVVDYGSVEEARVHTRAGVEVVTLERAGDRQRDGALDGNDPPELYELSVDDPLLARGLRLVDAPGVDSATPSHRAVAAEQLLRADLLIFIFDPEAPVIRPEARFLEEAAAALADVVFVVGKADVAVDLDAVVQADRRVLAQIAPRWADAPLFVLSAAEKFVADRTDAAALAQASGVPALAAHLSERVAPHLRVVRTAGVVQACRSVVQELEATDRAASLVDGAETSRAEAAVARHHAYVETSATWTGEFGREYQRHSRQVVERELRLRLLEGRESREVRIKSGHMKLDDVTRDVQTDLTEVAAHMERSLVEQIGALMSDWTVRLELGAVHLPEVAAGDRGDVLLPGLDVAGTNWHAREVTHGLAGLVNLARSAASGRSLASIVPGGLAMGTGVGLVMTGLSWGTSEWLRHKVQDQQGALAFVQAAFSRAQIELESRLREHALELQPVAQAALQRRIDERRRELAMEAAELQHAAERAAADADGGRAAAAARVAELAPWRQRLDAIAAAFTDFLRAGVLAGETNDTTTGADR